MIVPEVVLDDAEVVPVVVDVGRREKCVATPHDALACSDRARASRLPNPARPPFTILAARGIPLQIVRGSNVAVRGRLVVGKCRVGDLGGPALGRVLDECARARSFHVCWALSVLAGTTAQRTKTTKRSLTEENLAAGWATREKQLLTGLLLELH